MLPHAWLLPRALKHPVMLVCVANGSDQQFSLSRWPLAAAGPHQRPGEAHRWFKLQPYPQTPKVPWRTLGSEVAVEEQQEQVTPMRQGSGKFWCGSILHYFSPHFTHELIATDSKRQGQIWPWSFQWLAPAKCGESSWLYLYTRLGFEVSVFCSLMFSPPPSLSLAKNDLHVCLLWATFIWVIQQPLPTSTLQRVLNWSIHETVFLLWIWHNGLNSGPYFAIRFSGELPIDTVGSATQKSIASHCPFPVILVQIRRNSVWIKEATLYLHLCVYMSRMWLTSYKWAYMTEQSLLVQLNFSQTWVIIITLFCLLWEWVICTLF